MSKMHLPDLHLLKTTPLQLQGNALLYALVALTLALVLLFVRDLTRRPLRLPPQITPAPDKQRPWLHWHKESKRPGHEDVMCSVSGSRVNVILNSAEAVNELFEKRSTIYSARPRNVLSNLARRSLSLATISNQHAHFKPGRKLLNSVLMARAANDYIPWQTSESLVFLSDLLNEKQPWKVSLQRFLNNIVMLISYGKRAEKPELDPSFAEHKQTIEQGLKRLGGTSLVESWPILRFTPTFLARQFLPELVEAKRVFELDTPKRVARMEEAKARIDAGWPVWSMVRAIHEAEGGLRSAGLPYEGLAYITSVPYQAGVDTTGSELNLFFLAMIDHGDAFLARAREELDRVVGKDRLPTMNDELPFCDAIVKEFARYGRAAPIALPHATISADAYNGYDIPKNATVTANIWAISRDSRVYRDPDEFRPERWLNGEVPFALPFGMFGHGRRHCPGYHVAMNTLYITVRRLLWAFDISSTDSSYRGDKYGSWKSVGVITWPDDLPIKFTPRSSRHAEVIRQELRAVKPELDAMTPA